jgi:hypothetical protein
MLIPRRTSSEIRRRRKIKLIIDQDSPFTASGGPEAWRTGRMEEWDFITNLPTLQPSNLPIFQPPDLLN